MMLSPEIKEAIEASVKEQMSRILNECHRLKARIIALEEENRILKEKQTHILRKVDDSAKDCSHMNLEFDTRIDKIECFLRRLPTDFLEKILETSPRYAAVDSSFNFEWSREHNESSFDHDWSRERNEMYETASDLNDTDSQVAKQESLESMLSKEAKLQQEIGRKNLGLIAKRKEGLRENLAQPMSIESALADDDGTGKDNCKQTEKIKDISKQPMSIESALADDDGGTSKDNSEPIEKIKDISKQPMSIESALADDDGTGKDNYKQTETIKDISKQPLSLEGALAADDGGTSKDNCEPIEKVGENLSQLMSIESELETDTNRDRDASGCGTSELPSSEAKTKKEETSQPPESSKSGKMKKFFGLKSKGNSKS